MVYHPLEQPFASLLWLLFPQNSRGTVLNLSEVKHPCAINKQLFICLWQACWIGRDRTSVNILNIPKSFGRQSRVLDDGSRAHVWQQQTVSKYGILQTQTVNTANLTQKSNIKCWALDALAVFASVFVFCLFVFAFLLLLHSLYFCLHLHTSLYFCVISASTKLLLCISAVLLFSNCFL